LHHFYYKQLIILSHFAPSIKSVTPGYENSALNPYFCNNLDDLIKQIVQENNSIYKRYQLNEIDVVYETNGIYYICEKGR
jgi:hypothetical protein